MKTEFIRDFYGRLLGSIETDDQGNKIARDFALRVLGRYRKSDDMTTDFYGRQISHGDTVVSLIPSYEEQHK